MLRGGHSYEGRLSQSTSVVIAAKMPQKVTRDQLSGF
jgi:hypothetical protein